MEGGFFIRKRTLSLFYLVRIRFQGVCKQSSKYPFEIHRKNRIQDAVEVPLQKVNDSCIVFQCVIIWCKHYKLIDKTNLT